MDNWSVNLNSASMKALMEALTVDITLIDENDNIVYYNHADSRLFRRSPSLLGCKVQDCHKPESRANVDRMIDDLKSGKRQAVEQWVEHNGRRVFTRYTAIRDGSGRYLGILQTHQDITELQKLTGENRRY